MKATLIWRYAIIDQQLVLVADNQPGYRAEIQEILPVDSYHLRSWQLYEQEQVLIEGKCLKIASAKRLCLAMLKLAFLLDKAQRYTAS
jgi:hypothetical protein